MLMQSGSHKFYCYAESTRLSVKWLLFPHTLSCSSMLSARLQIMDAVQPSQKHHTICKISNKIRSVQQAFLPRKRSCSISDKGDNSTVDCQFSWNCSPVFIGTRYSPYLVKLLNVLARVYVSREQMRFDLSRKIILSPKQINLSTNAF